MDKYANIIVRRIIGRSTPSLAWGLITGKEKRIKGYGILESNALQ
jgi:hypothetical protein